MGKGDIGIKFSTAICGWGESDGVVLFQKMGKKENTFLARKGAKATRLSSRPFNAKKMTRTGGTLRRFPISIKTDGFFVSGKGLKGMDPRETSFLGGVKFLTPISSQREEVFPRRKVNG